MNKSINHQMLILQAIGIILVVLGHKGGISLLTDWFPAYSFHMPLFIFISGYFYSNNSEENTLNFIKKKFHRLLVPYFIWNIIYGILANLLALKGLVQFTKRLSFWNLFIEPWISGHQFGLNVASWFVPALFLVQMFYLLTRKTFKSLNLYNEYVFTFLFCSLGILGVILSNKGYTTGLSLVINRTLFLTTFFQLGYIYKSKLEVKDKLNNFTYFSILFIVQFLIILKYKDLNFSAVWCNNFNQENLLLPFISSITGTLLWLRISRILIPCLKDSKIFNAIGSNTFTIMMHHELVFYVINSFLALVYTRLNLTNFSYESYVTNGWYGYSIVDTKSLVFYVAAGVFVPLIARDSLLKLKYKFKSMIS